MLICADNTSVSTRMISPPDAIAAVGTAPSAPGGVAAPNSGQVIPGAGLEDGFIPAKSIGQDFDIAVHDITVHPGKTYRYKVRYAIQNPLWQSQTGI